MKNLKRFLSYYKKYRHLLVLDIVCAFVVSVVDVLVPQILRTLTNDYYIKGKGIILKALPYVFGILLFMFVLKLFCQYFIIKWGHIMGARMEGDMRRDLFNKIESLPYSYYDKHPTGDMNARMVSDLFDISELAHHGPENICLSVLKIAGSLVFLMMINVKQENQQF